jgi:hypothetical protein
MRLPIICRHFNSTGIAQPRQAAWDGRFALHHEFAEQISRNENWRLCCPFETRNSTDKLSVSVSNYTAPAASAYTIARRTRASACRWTGKAALQKKVYTQNYSRLAIFDSRVASVNKPVKDTVKSVNKNSEEIVHSFNTNILTIAALNETTSVYVRATTDGRHL